MVGEAQREIEGVHAKMEEHSDKDRRWKAGRRNAATKLAGTKLLVDPRL